MYTVTHQLATEYFLSSCGSRKQVFKKNKPTMSIQYSFIFMFWITTFIICSTDAIYGRFDDIGPSKISPKNIIPVKYDITIEPNWNTIPHMFNGNVTIELKVAKRTSNINLNVNGLVIENQTIVMTSSEGTIIPIYNTEYLPYQNLYTISFEKKLEESETYKLTIIYFGGLRNDNQGFYLAEYEDKNGTKRTLATTFFTKSNARSVFPCFDEPSMKAQFVIKIIRPENYYSLSNEEKVNTEVLSNGRFMDVFKETAKMSTYLVAFLISDFDYTSKNGLQQVFARPEAIEDGSADYILHESSKILEAVEKYVGMSYMFNKIDHVAIPDKYFNVEGLENWGLITYSEKTLLFSNKTHTTMDKQSSLTSVLHELIHQWFGNLVTPTEWKYLWLSEGLATYLQFRIGNSLQPSWRLLDQFQNIVVERAFEGEQSFFRSSLNEDSPQWVDYLKAAAIIRMVENFLTPTVFRKGLQNYIKDNQYSVVTPTDLYKALQTAAEEENATDLLGNNTVASIMATWDSVATYPVVNVTRNYSNGHITFEQEMFARRRKENHTWNIPINYVLNAKSAEDFVDTTADFWLKEKVQTLNEPFATHGWLIVNKQFSGYYQVNYDLTNWNRIIDFLNSPDFEIIPVLNRAQLIDDSFELAKTGKIGYAIPLRLSLYLQQEQDSVPLSSFLNAIEFLNKQLTTTDIYPEFQNYTLHILEKAYERLGFDEAVNDNYLDTINRANVLKWLCRLEHSDCRRLSLIKLRNWKENKLNVIFPNMQEPIFCGAISIGNQADWDFLYTKYETSKDTSERTRILNGLSCSENVEIITGFLDKIRNTSSTVRDVDRATSLLTIIESGKIGLNVTKNYVRQHFKEFWKLGLVEDTLNLIGSRLTTQQEYDELVEFKNEHRGSHMMFRPAMGMTWLNLQWKKNYLDEISNWFNATVILRPLTGSNT